MNQTEIQKAFSEYDRQVSIRHSRIGCVLAMLLMPLGSFSMDFFVYRDLLWPFFQLRMISALLTGVVLALLFTEWGKQRYRALGMAWYWIPLIAIALLIHQARDPISPYYAGFNLVIIAVGVVLPWTYREILATVVLIIGVYAGIYFFSGMERNLSYLANNLFFLGCTGIIIVTGSLTHSRLRYREFALRYELDQNKRQLEESNQKLKELDQIKGRFFANISHELRTPLTLMISPLETIQRRYAKSLDPDTQSLLQTMHSNGLRLLKLINDLLDLVRLDSGVLQVRREAILLGDFLRGLASAASQIASDKKIQLITSVAPGLHAIMADRDKMEKIILNLQFNALKFTPPGGRIEISATREGEDFVLRVSDTGIGIPAKNLPNMFERFFQVDSSSRRKFQPC